MAADPIGGVVVALRPNGARLDDIHAWLDEHRAAGADSFMVVAVNTAAGSADLREFGAEVHASVLATVILIVQAHAMEKFRPMYATPEPPASE